MSSNQDSEHKLFESFGISEEGLKIYRILSCFIMLTFFLWAKYTDDNIEDYNLLTHWGLTITGIYFLTNLICYWQLGTEEQNLHFYMKLTFEICYAFQCVILCFYFYVTEEEDDNIEEQNDDFMGKLYILSSHVIAPILIFIEGIFNRIEVDWAHSFWPILVYLSYVISNFLASKSSPIYSKIQWNGTDESYFYAVSGLFVAILGFAFCCLQSKLKTWWLERGIVKSYKKTKKMF